MSWLQSIQSMLPRPERRSESEINDDLADEFAFHLEQSRRAIIAEGEAPEQAAMIASRRFGDIEQIKKRCRRIALEERVMLQRFNAVMMVVVGLLVAGLAVQVWMMQRDNTRALERITAQISQISTGGGAAGGRGGDGGAPVIESGLAAAGRGMVYVSGAVSRGGVYQLPSGLELTLSKLLVACAAKGQPDSVEVRRKVGGKMEILTISLKEAGGADFVLQAGDEVRVPTPEGGRPAPGGENALASAIPVGGGQPNIWLQIDEAGKFIDDVRLELLEQGDVRNLSGELEGRLVHGTETRYLTFSDRDLGLNLEMRKQPLGSISEGRWTFDAGVLTVNTADAVPEFTAPLRFSRLSARDVDALKARDEEREALRTAHRTPDNKPISGLWREIDADGKPFDAGAQIVMMGLDDKHNTTGKAGAVFVLRADAEEMGLTFQPQDSNPNLTIHQANVGGAAGWSEASGHWDMAADGTLTLDIAKAVPARSAAIKLNRISDVPATVYQPDAATNGGTVNVSGTTVRAGTYQLPGVGQLSVRRLFILAGGKRDAGPVVVTVSSQGVARFHHDDLFASDATDCLAKPGEVITFQQKAGAAALDVDGAGARVPQPDAPEALAQLEHAKAQAVADFLNQVLIAQDARQSGGAAAGVSVKDLLDRAANDAETKFKDQPEVRAAVQQTIAQARKDLGNSPAATQPAAGPKP